MSAATKQVKATRPYNRSGRQAIAQQQLQATLDVARAAFLSKGYVATTVESIASEAGVSPATIYKSYGGKRGLIQLLCKTALEGARGPTAYERSNALRAEDDPRRIIAGWGKLRAEVSPRFSPLLLVLRDAAKLDADAAAVYDEMDRENLRRMRENANHLVATGRLRRGVDTTAVRDVLWLSVAPELYELLVVKRRWSVARYSRFCDDMIASAVL